MKTRIIALATAIGIGTSVLFSTGASAAQNVTVTTFAVPAVSCTPFTYYYPIVPGWEGSGQLSTTRSWSGGICTTTIYQYY